MSDKIVRFPVEIEAVAWANIVETLAKISTGKSWEIKNA